MTREAHPKDWFAAHPEEKVVLAVDLDEVCFGYLPALRAYLAKQGIEVPASDPEVFSLMEAGWFEAIEDFHRHHSAAVEAGLYTQLQMLEGASKTLWELHEAGYENNIITSRFVVKRQHRLVVTQTAEALDAADIPYSNLAFLANKTRFLADAYLDDGPHNITPLREAGRYVIRVNQLYNSKLEGPSASNWSEIRELLWERFGR